MTELSRVYIRYFTKDKIAKINPKNIKAYDKYLRSNIIKNKEVKETTYKTYQNYFNQFLVYLSEEWENISIHDEEFLEEAVDILEGFIGFCQDKLGNNKKVINTKLSAVSSYFLWALKRGYVEAHPFNMKLDRMKGAGDEKLIGHHFLTDEQIDTITKTIHEEYVKEKGGAFDLQDLLIWHIALDSANRLGALYLLKWSKLDLDNMVFVDIREKRGKIVEVPFAETSATLLADWAELRKEIDNLECDSIFMVRHDKEYKAMSKVSIYKRVKKMGTIIGLDDFRPHCIRKTTLNRIVEKTGDLTLAQEMGNHSDVSTTQKHYVRQKSKAEIRDKIRNLMK